VESFRFLAESKQPSLHVLADAHHLVMDFDRDKLLQVLYNLLSNAIKFTPERGQISVQVASAEPSSLSITIADTGVGIPPEDLPRVFDRFYQVDASSTRQHKGTGIGLSPVRELIQLMHGEIKVESKPGHGTTFRIQLPITQMAPLATADARPKRENWVEKLTSPLTAEDFSATPGVSSGELPSLLIIEDNPDLVEYLVGSQENHYTLLIARNGQAGIAIALDQVPDLIISDVMMPLKDGFEVCQSLKTDPRTSHIPIILLPAKADHEARIEGLSRGADAYLAKPFHPRELFVRLEKLLQLRRTLQARYTDLQQATEPALAYQQEDDFIQQVNASIHQHLHDHTFGLHELCQAIGMSRSSLYRKLNALTGLSVSRYIRRYHLHQARHLLLYSDLQVTEIAYEVGFSDPSYFSRTFTQEFGVPPRKIREA